jgi:predicted deacylase
LSSISDLNALTPSLSNPEYASAFAFSPNCQHRIAIPIARLPTQTELSLAITIIHGHEPGPTLWLSAALHGDELNGVEIIRQVLQRLDCMRVRGTIIAAPIVNIFGFIDQSRYLPDRRDLNRSFPGAANGSLASRLAHLFMTEVVHRSTHGIDLHTASDHRINWPQIRANLDDPATAAIAQAFAPPALLHANIRDGSLREAAGKRGIPVLLYEAGEAMRFNHEAIHTGVTGILRVMAALQMCPLSPNLDPPAAPVVQAHKTKWIRAARSGLLRLQVQLGSHVTKRQVIGIVADVFGEHPSLVRATTAGVVIGYTQKPLVNQGDAIVHLAIGEAIADPAPDHPTPEPTH